MKNKEKLEQVEVIAFIEKEIARARLEAIKEFVELFKPKTSTFNPLGGMVFTEGVSRVDLYEYLKQQLSKLSKEYESICQVCGEKYDRTQDSQEIAESGEYICKKCWDKEE